MKFSFSLISILFMLVSYQSIAQITAPTNVSAVRVEGAFTAVEYDIGGSGFTTSGVCWGTSNASERPNADEDNTVDRSISSTGTYRDSLATPTLTTNTTYYFRAYVTDGTDTLYTPAIGQAPNSFTTRENTQPIGSVTGLSFESKDSTSVTLDWEESVFNPADFWLLRHNEGSTAPVSGDFQDSDGAPFTLGNDDQNLPTQTSGASVSGLSKNTTYSFSVAPGNHSGWFTGPLNLRQDYPTSLTSITTDKGVPLSQASNITFSDTTSTTFTVEWTRGDGDQCVVFIANDGSVTVPSEGVAYTADDSWNNAGDQCVYKGIETSVQVTNINDYDDYTVRVFEFNNPGSTEYYQDNKPTNNPRTLYGNCTWNGSSGTTWGTAGNWDGNNIPGSNNRVTIPDAGSNDAPEISSNTTIDQLTIEAGGELTVSDGTLSVAGDVTIGSSSSASGALLDTGGSVSVGGTATYNRYVADDDYWHLISNPTNGGEITALTAYYADEWDEPNAEWDYLTASSTLNTMVGYSVSHGGNTDYNEYIEFSGSDFNDGSPNIGVTNSNLSDDSYGWNLVGNPYPSAIDWNASSGWSRTNINSTIYQYNPSTGGYLSYSHSSGGSGDVDARYAQAGQGFFILCESSSATLGMTNEVRVSSSRSFLKNTTKNHNRSEKSSITLNITNNIIEDNTYIVFYPGATENYDQEFDGPKLFGSNDNLPQIYSVLETNEELAINVLPKTAISEISADYYIPIGLKTRINHTFSFSLADSINIPDSLDVLLVDYEANERVSLLENDYEFYANTGTHNNRFAICISPDGGTGINNLNNSLFTYVNNSELYVNHESTIKNGKIIVTDILGRTIINKSLTSKSTHVFKIPEKTNIFVVNIYEDNQVVYRKKHVNLK